MEPTIELSASCTLTLGESEDRILTVVEGCVELFLVSTDETGEGRRYHFATLEKGSWIFDVGFNHRLSVLAAGQKGTRVSVQTLSAGPLELPVEWISLLEERVRAFVSASRGGAAEVKPDPGPLDELAGFHKRMLDVLLEAIRIRSVGELSARETHSRLRSAAEDNAWRGIATALNDGEDGRPSVASPMPPSSAGIVFARVARLMGIDPKSPSHVTQGDKSDELAALARASSVRMRRVVLNAGWHRNDNGPLIGFLGQPDEAVALIPLPKGGYGMEKSDGSQERVHDGNASLLAPQACCLYRSLPDRELSLRDIVRFCMRGNGKDICLISVLVVIAGLLALVLPSWLRHTFDVVVPEAERGIMLQIGLAMLVAAVLRSVLELVRSIAVLRIQGRTDASLQAALWDRILKLPVRFFRDYPAGDLVSRAQSVSAMHTVLSSVGVTALLAVPTALFTFIVMLEFSVELSLCGLGLALGAVAVSIALNSRQIMILHKVYDAMGKLSGLVFQFIGGIAKLRIAGAEQFAFAAWAGGYVEKERLSRRAGRWRVASRAFFSGYALIASLVIYGAAGSLKSPLTTGEFLAFNAAFGALIASLTMAGDGSLGLLKLIPLMRRTRPIFEARPEITEFRGDPGTLEGAIEISNVRFRYFPNTPPVLDIAKLRIEPGEFVAITGSSGSGKSTLLRLLLGFETSESGTIFYDGKDLRMLDVGQVRLQIGVVLQNPRLLAGDIFRNIAGESNLTIEDAWRAAELAGVDRTIRRFPMQMQTPVNEGGRNLSEGQRQRIAIARALVRNPKLVFFDEATSALDNVTQAAISASLEKIQATRVVIAHRISTIRRADRIIVLDAGRIVEEGSYDRLMNKEGVFHRLAIRQIAG